MRILLVLASLLIPQAVHASTITCSGNVDRLYLRASDGDVMVNYGLVTEGDLDQIRATQTFGRTWGSGRALVSYEYLDQDALFADDKAFAEVAPDPLTLLPGQERHSVTASWRLYPNR